MYDENSDTNMSQSKPEENGEEIDWVFFGMLATWAMVVYQFFLVYFMNIPSTISVRITLSLWIGLIAITITSSIKFWKYTKEKQEVESNSFDKRNVQEEGDTEGDLYYEDDDNDDQTLMRKNSIWKYVSSFVQRIK